MKLYTAKPATPATQYDLLRIATQYLYRYLAAASKAQPPERSPDRGEREAAKPTASRRAATG